MLSQALGPRRGSSNGQVARQISLYSGDDGQMWRRRVQVPLGYPVFADSAPESPILVWIEADKVLMTRDNIVLSRPKTAVVKT
jgi:hypothetical protein